MNSPRILFVNHTSRMGGAEFVLLDVVSGWPNASAFLFEQGPLNLTLKEKGLNVVRSRWGAGLGAFRRDSRWWAAFPLSGNIAALIIELAKSARQHDLIYANSQKAFVVASMAAALVGRPLVWHLHDVIDSAHFGNIQRQVQVALANRTASRVVVPSGAAASAFIKAGGRRDLVEVVSNGVSVRREDKSKSMLRRELGLPPGPLVGVFSRLSPWKGQHVLLSALAHVEEVQCVIVGDALFGEYEYAARLKRLAHEHGLDDRVRFLGERSDVPRLMQAIDIMVHPSVAPEPFGRTLVEAMLAGVPVIATDTGAAAEILESGAAGTLVAANDDHGLAVAIEHILSDPVEVSMKAKYATMRAKSIFSVEEMLKKISDVVGCAVAGVQL